jgi:two-component system sensor histidine kinase KdpD
VALVGGFAPAILAAVAGSLLLNYYFTPPLHHWTIAARENMLALAGYVLIAAAVSAVVDLAARRTREAARASADAQVLSTLAGSVLRGERALTAILERLRETYGLTSATLLERRPEAALGPDLQRDPDAWLVAASAGAPACRWPDEGDAELPVGDDLVLVLRGRPLPARERRIAEAFAAQAAVALRQQRLAEQASRAGPLAQADRMRTALLNAVSHDLRTPLASAKAAVDSLGSADLAWTEEDRAELLATAGESLDRLDRLVANLLDMSRLQAGALGISVQPLAVEDVLARALDELGPGGRAVRLALPDGLPELLADPALLERVLVNVLGNALRHNPPGKPVLVSASTLDGTMQIRIADRGPGIPPAERDRVFLPFQRLGDRGNDSGVGLGLALSRGLAEAMGGTLEPDDTPGGGLTMTLTVPANIPPINTEPGDSVPSPPTDAAVSR